MPRTLTLAAGQQSGNPLGRRKGSRNRFSLAVMAVDRPVTLDRTKPYECWNDRYVQDGRDFHKVTMELLDKDAPPPMRPKLLDIQEPRQTLIWKEKMPLIQGSWLYDPATHLPINPCSWLFEGYQHQTPK